MSWLLTGQATLEAWQEVLVNAALACQSFHDTLVSVMGRAGLRPGSTFSPERMLAELTDRARADLRNHALQFGVDRAGEILSPDEIERLLPPDSSTQDLDLYWQTLVTAYGHGRPQQLAYRKAAKTLKRHWNLYEDMRVVGGNAVLPHTAYLDETFHGNWRLSGSSRERWAETRKALRVFATWAADENLMADVAHIDAAIGRFESTLCSRDKHTNSGTLSVTVFKTRLEFRLRLDVAARLNEFMALNEDPVPSAWAG